MEYIITALWVFLELLSYIFLADSFFQRRERTKKAWVISVCAMWLIMFCYSRFITNGLIKLAVTLLCASYLSIYLFRGLWLHHVLCILAIYIFGNVFDVGIVSGTSILLKMSYSELVWRQFLYTIICTSSKLLCVFLAYLIRHVRKPIGPQKVHANWLLLMLIFPIVSMAMLIILAQSYRDQQDLSVSAFIFSCILAIANIAVLYLLSAMEKSMRKEQEITLLNQEIEIQAKNIVVVEKNFQAQRKATHEFKHHLQTIQSLLNCNQPEQAKAYVDQLQGIPMLRVQTVNSLNPIVDVVLNQKYQEARDSATEMNIQINDLSTISIKSDLLVVLLANLLDNAIEACQRIDGERIIHCRILNEENLFISVRNTSLPIAVSNGYIQTSKFPKEQHGYGLSNIFNILTLLNAEYTIEYDKGWFQFSIEISNCSS